MLDKLKEYRETIAIVLFFLGGFVWIKSTFPDRAYLDDKLKMTSSQMAQLNCLLTNNISATDAQLQIKIHADNIDHSRIELVSLKRKSLSDISDDEREKIDSLTREIENERDFLQRERVRSDQILRSIKAGCRDV